MWSRLFVLMIVGIIYIAGATSAALQPPVALNSPIRTYYHMGGHQHYLIPVMHQGWHVAFYAAHTPDATGILKGSCFKKLNGEIFTEEEPWQCGTCKVALNWYEKDGTSNLWFSYARGD